MLSRIRTRLMRSVRRGVGGIFTPAPAHRVIMLLGALLTVMFLAVTLVSPSSFWLLDSAVYDEMFRLLGGSSPPEVAVVDVDERSLAKLGQWPWPRYRIAALVERASALGARSIAVDFLFPEPDRLSLSEIGRVYLRDRNVQLDLNNVPSGVLDNDQTLADAIAQHNVVLGGDLVFDEEPGRAMGECRSSLSVVLRGLSGAASRPPVFEASGMVCPIPALADAATYVGAVNTLPDRDGKIRRVPLVFRVGDTWVPSLPMAALLAAAGENQVIMTYSAAGISEVRVGDVDVPTDHQGNMLLSYRTNPASRFRHVSAVDLLEDRVDPRLIAGKVVFVGTSASGLGDSHPTPAGRVCPGIDLHALAADTILHKDFFTEPAWGRGVQVVSVLVAGVLVSVLAAWTYVTLCALVTAAGLVFLAFGSWSLFEHWGIYCSPVPGMTMLLVGSSVLTLVRLRYEERRERLLKQSFERYVSSQIVDQIIHSAEPVNLSGERRTVTILMSDIRGFTSLSERMPPENLVRFLNSYFAAMIDIILANEGTLDKFMGDAVLALFGAPIPHHDDALRAVRVAVAMQDKLRELNEQWIERGQPQIRIGIGISTGDVIVGNIGSARRLEYTAIGQDVNYAQRIEALTKDLKEDILVHETTYEKVKDYVEAEKFCPLTIRGRDAPIHVYAIRGLVKRL